MKSARHVTIIVCALACSLAQASTPAARTSSNTPVFVGTDAPFAANAIYFVMTDRFVNGDPSNDHRHQGGAHPTFNIPVAGAPKVRKRKHRLPRR